MKYITYIEHNIGGLGHSFCDWLSCFILSQILNYPFIFDKLPVWSNLNRSMDVNNTSNKFFWNNYLNLENLSQNVIDKKNLNLSNYKQIPIIFNSWCGTDIDKIKSLIETNNNKHENIIYYFKSNTRIYLFDLFNYDIINKTTFTFNILNELNHVYYLKNSKIHKDKDLINIYLRYGDLRKNKINEKKPVSNNFELNMLEKLSSQLNMNNCIVNIISAGKKTDLCDIKNDFSKFSNINYLFNVEQDKAFHLMTQSDYLIFSESGFAYTASLYCKGQIYICKDTFCIIPRLIYSDVKYLENYHII